MPSILFVCTANRSRSPMAAACFQKELTRRGVGNGWRVSSAGTWTTDGLAATPDAITSGNILGIDLSSHRSKEVTTETIRVADLVIVMEQGQKEALQAEFPAANDKVHLLSEVATGSSYDIPDPQASPSPSDVYVEIDDLIRKGFDRITTLPRIEKGFAPLRERRDHEDQ